jgi:hypothetical protein
MKFSDFEIINDKLPTWLDSGMECIEIITLKKDGLSIAFITKTQGGKYNASINGKEYFSAGRSEAYCLKTIKSLLKSTYIEYQLKYAAMALIG